MMDTSEFSPIDREVPYKTIRISECEVIHFSGDSKCPRFLRMEALEHEEDNGSILDGITLYLDQFVAEEMIDTLQAWLDSQKVKT